KHIAATALSGADGRSYLRGIFRLEYVENPGAFLSLGSELPDWARTGVLTIGAAIGVLIVALAAYKLRWRGIPLIGAMLLIAGGASDLVDRIVRGRVVDFMSVGIGPLRTGIFNVADIALITGVLLICTGKPPMHPDITSGNS